MGFQTMIPLKLSSYEQNALADLCSICRSIKYEMDCDKDVDMKNLTEDIGNLVLRYDRLTPQRWDIMYDILHRTGENT